MIGFMLVIGLYLIVALAFPLYAMLSKSFSTYSFDLNNFEFQVDKGEGWSDPVTAQALNEDLQVVKLEELATSSDGRLAATVFFPDFSFRSTTKYRLRQIRAESSFLVGSTRIADTEWHEFESNKFRRIWFCLRIESQQDAFQRSIPVDRDGADTGAIPVARYCPDLSIWQSGHD